MDVGVLSSDPEGRLHRDPPCGSPPRDHNDGRPDLVTPGCPPEPRLSHVDVGVDQTRRQIAPVQVVDLGLTFIARESVHRDLHGRPDS